MHNAFPADVVFTAAEEEGVYTISPAPAPDQNLFQVHTAAVNIVYDDQGNVVGATEYARTTETYERINETQWRLKDTPGPRWTREQSGGESGVQPANKK